LCLQTDATTLEVETVLTGLHYLGGERRPIVFDLLIDGQPNSRQSIAGGGAYIVDFGCYPPGVVRRSAPPEHIRFADLPPGMKHLALWLPHNAEVKLTAVRVNADARVLPAVSTAPRWVHHGSSISHGKEVEGPAGIWPALVAQDLGLDLTALGFSGQCMLDGAVARVIAQQDAAVISLKLGANVVAADTMRGRTFRSAVHNLLDIIRERQPATPILVISPITAPILERDPGPALRAPGGFAKIPRPPELMDDALTLRLTREILADCIALRRGLGDLALHYLDGQQLLGERDADLLVDGLHPDARGHSLIAERLMPILAGLLPQPVSAATAS
jgi:lysophospholipase L1-like esterase